MGQIENNNNNRRKKKGRPSKADLAARQRRRSGDADDGGGCDAAAEQERRDLRRSLRRRSFRYSIIDYDEDYLDDDGDDDDEVQLFEEDEDEEERESDDDERRREKKVKLVLKLNNSNSSSKSKKNSSISSNRASFGRVDSVSRASRRGRGEEEEEEEDEDEEEVEEEDEEERREVKKRRISGGEGEEDGVDEYDEDENGGNDDDDEVIDDKVESKRGDSVPGMPTYNKRSSTPLPDKKLLELILDKLQKKDTYGVYAEPVDPEELPDYFDIIKHPMDFATVRKKLANGSYSTLEQFESDVFLICSNAMQYNAPETVYHKQARAIKELAEKKFQRIRIQIERLEREPKPEPKCEPKSEPRSEQRDRPNSLVKKQSKKPFCRSTQETVGSDFSCGAALATTEAPNTCSTDHVGNVEKPSNNDVQVEGISSLADNNIEKAEDPQSGKGLLPKYGRRSFVVDENRRATYNISTQPMDRSESIFTPFEEEKKQLIPVGLPGEYTYARSLARFAANLGPSAWRTASKRIEQVLPPDFKYGRGWVGEYEPLPTAVLVLEGRKENSSIPRLHDVVESGKNAKRLDCTPVAKKHLLNQPSSEGKLASIFGSGDAKQPTPTVSISQQQNPLCRGSGWPENMMVKRVESNCQSANNQKNSVPFQQQNRFPRDSACPENMGAKRVEPNSPSTSNQKIDHIMQRQPRRADMGAKSVETNSPSTSNQKIDHILQRQPPCAAEMGGKKIEPNCPSISNSKANHVTQKHPSSMEMPASRPIESVPKGKNFLQSLPFKQPDANGSTPEGLHNGKIMNKFVDSNRVIASSTGLIPTQLAGPAASFPQRQDQGLSDPVLVMKMLTEKAQKQQNGSVHAHNPSQSRPSVPSPRGDSGSNAAAAAASAWMSVGAAGFRPAAQNPVASRSQVSADPMYNTTRVFYPQAMQSYAEYPVSGTMHFQPENKGLPYQAFVSQPNRVSNEQQIQNRPMVFPQMVTNDLSRFQVQAPWQGLSPHTQQKQKQKQKQDTLPPDLNVAFQSVDSQQPDLALQL